MTARRLWTFCAVASIAGAALGQAKPSATAFTSAQSSAAATSATDSTAAAYWGLSMEDYQRYQTLMKGVRGALSAPNITPIEVLGIHARSDAERRKYADMFARLMAEDTQRVLQFQAEYGRSIHRLYPTLVAVGPAAQRTQADAPTSSSLVAFSTPKAVMSGDRVLLFTRDGCTACDEAVRRALATAASGVTVDLYVVDARAPEDVQRLARRLAVDPALVEAGRLTLNVDGGTFARVFPAGPALPAAVRKRGQSFVAIAASEL